jgi:hypothetical protein
MCYPRGIGGIPGSFPVMPVGIRSYSIESIVKGTLCRLSYLKKAKLGIAECIPPISSQ